MLGWESELDALWAETAPILSSEVTGTTVEETDAETADERSHGGDEKAAPVKSPAVKDAIDDIVDNLANKVEGLNFTDDTAAPADLKSTEVDSTVKPEDGPKKSEKVENLNEDERLKSEDERREEKVDPKCEGDMGKL